MASTLELCQRTITRLANAALANYVLRFGGGREATYAVTASTGSTVVDLTNGNTQVVTLQADTALTLSGATVDTSCTISLYLVQDSTGGRVVTWPAGTKWPAGVEPTLSIAAGARDLVVLETLDGGTTWYATASLDFS